MNTLEVGTEILKYGRGVLPEMLLTITRVSPKMAFAKINEAGAEYKFRREIGKDGWVKEVTSDAWFNRSSFFVATEEGKIKWENQKMRLRLKNFVEKFDCKKLTDDQVKQMLIAVQPFGVGK